MGQTPSKTVEFTGAMAAITHDQERMGNETNMQRGERKDANIRINSQFRISRWNVWTRESQLQMICKDGKLISRCSKPGLTYTAQPAAKLGAGSHNAGYVSMTD